MTMGIIVAVIVIIAIPVIIFLVCRSKRNRRAEVAISTSLMV